MKFCRDVPNPSESDYGELLVKNMELIHPKAVMFLTSSSRSPDTWSSARCPRCKRSKRFCNDTRPPPAWHFNAGLATRSET